MVFKLKAAPRPAFCYMPTRLLKLELGLSGGLGPIADLWKVTLKSNPGDTIRDIQKAMIAREIEAGNMWEGFTVQAWIRIAMTRDPELSRAQNLDKFTKLVGVAKFPFKRIEAVAKPRITKEVVTLGFWSKGFSATIEDRIFFLDGNRFDARFNPVSYPKVFPTLPAPLVYRACSLKAGAHRG